ncbi:MAG: carbonate dehydratase [Candidatus Margulisiibacteriota bacterium]|nr:MAG: hypothetical protein A2X43_08585 [Candidatus Margulisbacteria bacterium GWD2_39_127]OGI05105.1 MAG: hypothetical protein A2X42_12600 [Candidatus Margulisbacteria bacterium GWF2_38_17]OGI09193.1 MAG: hypothetical protein A2X41_01290 [Candidatus Margulisbacteria bacterium GWE2_39_32]PZM81868.1 MAG: carbonate dehydratase [Candidatus Margulisiibacteriota bacterium]HAR63083.1 carbonate dehydratase [Candidatus Margulisiibacteriota bacterium]
MITKNPEGKLPQISKNSFVHPSAVIIGNVNIGKNVFIGPYAVIRADELQSSIIIGDNSNVQDGVIIHALSKTTVKVGMKTSLSHGCLIHGPCNIGNNCFIGFKSIIFKATIMDDVFIEHSALIENVEIAANSKIGSSSTIKTSNSDEIKPIDKQSIEFKQKVLDANNYLVAGYRIG